MEQIDPSTLSDRLAEYFAGHHHDGLFVASLDHSPTEQLIGEKWHTSALILSALFIAHFLRRMHLQMHVALSAHVTWNFFADKPPNGIGGAFDNALAMLLGLSTPGGRLRWGYFIEGDSVETDLLADNVAGLLNEIIRVPERYPRQFGPDERSLEGLFYWERWTT